MELFLKKREYHLFGFLKKTGLNPSGLKISVLRKEKKPKNSNWIGLNLLFFCFRQKKGLVKKLFFKAFSISVLCFGISLVFLPAGVSASSSDIGALKGKISEYEGVVQKFLNRLNTCRSECISRCREACPMVGETGSSTRQKCLASCTNDKCDKEVCYTVKQNHEKYKGELGKYKKALAEIENKASNPDPETNSPLEQVRREKDDMKIYKAIGAAATAFLGYKTATCCSSKKCRASGRCYLYGAMTAAAALQTSQMGGKKGELRNTELKLCVNDPNSANRCIDDGPGDDGGNGIPEIAPYCKDNPARCDTTGGIFVGCGEGEPECNEETLRKKLRTVLKPPGGWPESIDPFSLDNKGLSHKKLSPAQRRHINQMMEPFNRQNQAYLNKKGLGSKGFTAAGQKSIASSPAGQSGSLGGASGFGSGSYGGLDQVLRGV